MKNITVLRKRSRKHTSDAVRNAVEHENEDHKRFPNFLRKSCEEAHCPFSVEINCYLMQDDDVNIQIERPLAVPQANAEEQRKKPKICIYCSMELTLKKITCKVPLMSSSLFEALVKTTSSFPSLYTIRLDYCDITSNDIKLLAEQLNSKKTIKELSLKGSRNEEQNFYLLIGCGLKYLNLKFCGLKKNGLKKIADEFSKCALEGSILYLDLSSNMVFDEGCKYVAKILRCDRVLQLLNLADCKIGDEGFVDIINSFQKFPLSDEELYVRRKLRMEYYKLLQKEKDGLSIEKKNVFSAGDREHSKDALAAIEEKLRKHPFTDDCVQEGDDIFCKGNYKLQSLNISFNHLTKPSFELMLKVLMEQASTFGIEKGLNRLVLDGNPEDHITENVRYAIEELLMTKKSCIRYSQTSAGSVKSRASVRKRKSSASGLLESTKNSIITNI